MKTITLEIPESTIRQAREIRDAAKSPDLAINDAYVNLGACIAAIGFFLDAADVTSKRDSP